MKMKSADVVDGGLFTESYCNICNAQLISESQRTAHYEVSRSTLSELSERRGKMEIGLIWKADSSAVSSTSASFVPL